MRSGAAENAGGATAPMLNDFTGADKVYIACGYTDLRIGITQHPMPYIPRPLRSDRTQD